MISQKDITNENRNYILTASGITIGKQHLAHANIKKENLIYERISGK